MKRLFAALLASLVLVTGSICVICANDIVLPDDDFEEEVTFITGDVNGDGDVNMNDYTLLARIVNGAKIVPDGDPDVDHDGNVTLNDYTRLSRIVNGANLS